MIMDEIEIWKILFPAITGFLGIVLGIIINIISNWKLKIKETKLRLVEKIFDKRIKAHEEILLLSKLMRSTVSTEKVDENNNLISYPGLIQDKKTFENFQERFYELTNFNTHWLDIEICREINFIQDYIATLKLKIQRKNENDYSQIGIIIKPDFTKLAHDLEELVLKFFDQDILKLKLKSEKGYHKFEREITETRLLNTELIKKENEINK